MTKRRNSPPGPPNSAVPIPVITATVLRDDKVEATWTSPPELGTWHVQLLTGEGGVIRAVSVSHRRVRLTGLWSMTDYGLRVRAVDHLGRISDWSDVSAFATEDFAAKSNAAMERADAYEETPVVAEGHGRGADADGAGHRGCAVDGSVTPSSSAARFVILPSSPVADGVMFADGLVVVRSRTSFALEIYARGLGEVPIHARRDLVWIDEPPAGTLR